MFATLPIEPDWMKSITFGSSISPMTTRRIAAGITIGIEARTACRTPSGPLSDRIRSR